MKKLSFAIVMMIMVLGLCACGNSLKVGEKVDYETNTYEGVSMELIESPTNTSVVVEILNETDLEINSGNAYDFAIQVEKDREWYSIKTSERSINADALIYPQNQPVTMILSWEVVYGDLPARHYRIIKRFFTWSEDTGSGESFILSVEFNIN